MKILLVAPQPFFEERGTPIATRWVAETLCAAGHRVDLLCYSVGEDVAIEGLRIIRAQGPRGVTSIPIGFSPRKLRCDLHLMLALWRQLRREEYHVLHAVEEMIFPCMLLKRLFRCRLVYDMDSSMADQLLEKWSWLRPVGGVLRWFEKQAFRRADLVLPVCEVLAQQALAAAPEQRVCILRDIAVEGDDSQVPESLRTEFDLTGPLIMYVGNLEHYQGIDLMLAALEQLHARGAYEWSAIIIGGKQEDIAHYRDVAAQRGLDKRVVFSGPRPLGLLSGYLEQADILMSPRSKGVNTPLKVYSYMMAGKALVATDIASHTQVLDESCAKIVPPEAHAMADALEALLVNREQRRELGRVVRKRALERHSRQAYERILLSAYTFELYIDIPGDDTGGIEEA